MATEQLKAVMQPIDRAFGLPNAVYVDADMAQMEQQKVFARHWAALTAAKNLPKAGCVMPITFFGIPLLVTRTKSGGIKVFENVCRHRGMILVDEPKQLNGPITCPYHAWAYDLDASCTRPRILAVRASTNTNLWIRHACR